MVFFPTSWEEFTIKLIDSLMTETRLTSRVFEILSQLFEMFQNDLKTNFQDLFLA
jgi:hypothetical protein